MLIEKTLFGETVDRVEIAIMRLRQFEPPEDGIDILTDLKLLGND